MAQPLVIASNSPDKLSCPLSFISSHSYKSSHKTPLYKIMRNLFSIFDPNSFASLPLNWVSIFMGTLLLPQAFWLVPNQVSYSLKQTLTFLHQEFMAILGPYSAPGVTWVSVSLLVFILTNNALGLVPYIFTASSHLRFTLTLALPLWLGHVLASWICQPIRILAHLVPLGTPYPLMPFIVLIELVRSLIRPGTLAVRLAANIVAGHLLLTLIGSLAPSLGAALLLGLLRGLVLLITLECAVALIQSYVFRILMTLYVEEVRTPKIANILNKNPINQA